MADTSAPNAVNINAPGYTLRFALVVCLICAALVSVSAVSLRPMQQANALLYKDKNVLIVAGLAEPGQSMTIAEVDAAFAEAIEPRLIDRRNGTLTAATPAEARLFDQRAARQDPASSSVAAANPAGVRRLPDLSVAYLVRDGGTLEQVVLPVEGQGMWGPIYGFISVTPDAQTLLGLTIYEHKETPGLGAEIANPDWLALWRGRAPFDDLGEPTLAVIKGIAGSPEDDPLRVDGIAGATITSNAITYLIQFWLGEDGHGPLLRRLREGESL